MTERGGALGLPRVEGMRMVVRVMGKMTDCGRYMSNVGLEAGFWFGAALMPLYFGERDWMICIKSWGNFSQSYTSLNAHMTVWSWGPPQEFRFSSSNVTTPIRYRLSSRYDQARVQASHVIHMYPPKAALVNTTFSPWRYITDDKEKFIKISRLAVWSSFLLKLCIRRTSIDSGPLPPPPLLEHVRPKRVK